MFGCFIVQAMEGKRDIPARLEFRRISSELWAAVEKGFSDAGFRLDDKNRSEGVFYVTYVGPDGEDDDGWFSWLWGSERDDPLVGQEFQVQLAEDVAAQIVISIVNIEGQSLDELEQQGLLTLLQGNIT